MANQNNSTVQDLFFKRSDSTVMFYFIIPNTAEVCVCNFLTQRRERTGGGQKGQPPCWGSSVLYLSCVTEKAIRPRLTLTKVQLFPLGLHTHNHPSLALISYRAATLSAFVHVCGSEDTVSGVVLAQSH